MIVIPMAGLSRRFRDAGYEQPKYMLELDGTTVFARAVESFRRYFDSEPFLFVARDVADTAGFLSRQIDRLGLRDGRIAMLERETAGQADTVRLGLAAAGVADDEAITIFNIDTFRPGFRYPDTDWMARADGYLEVMTGTDPGFSFVLPDAAGDGRVARTTEKDPVSDLASTGLYWFRHAGVFVRAVAAGPNHLNGEIYVAPLYNQLIAAGGDVRYAHVAAHEIVMCGTPDQYRALRSGSPVA